jgi:AraC-like DNA-binding protein
MEIPIEKINEFVEKNLKQEFSLSDISDYAGYSAYHLSREYKKLTGRSIMDFVRERKIFEAANEVANGDSILEIALAYGVDTHSGFTRAFSETIGCSPQEYYQHKLKIQSKGELIMDKSKLKIRLVCTDDLNALWENCYSAMTPKQITEEKILPSIENYKNQNGFMAVAEFDGKVIMTMWVERLYSSPGDIWDSHYTWQNNDNDIIFTELLDGVKKFAKALHIPVLCLYENEGSPHIEGFLKGGFKEVFTAKGLVYTMCEL